VALEGTTRPPKSQFENLCFDSFIDSLWCPLDAIPGPEVDEAEGALFYSWFFLAPGFIFLTRSPLAECQPKLAFSLLDGTFDESERFVNFSAMFEIITI
jgi:hypothetical protein